jgi:hypothetical protein
MQNYVDPFLEDLYLKYVKTFSGLKDILSSETIE